MDVVGQQNDAVEIPAEILDNVGVLSNIVSNFDTETLSSLSHAFPSFTSHVLKNCNITNGIAVTKYTLSPLIRSECGSLLNEIGVDSSDDDTRFDGMDEKYRDQLNRIREEIVLHDVDAQGFNPEVLDPILGFNMSTCASLDPFGRGDVTGIRFGYISRKMGSLFALPQDGEISNACLQLQLRVGQDSPTDSHRVHIDGLHAGNDVINLYDGQIVSLYMKTLLGYKLSIKTDFLFLEEVALDPVDDNGGVEEQPTEVVVEQKQPAVEEVVVNENYNMPIELKGESDKYVYEFPLDPIITSGPFPPLCFCCDEKARTVWSNTSNRWILRLLCGECCK